MCARGPDILPTSEDLFPGMSMPTRAFARVSSALHLHGPRHVKSFEETAESLGPLSSYPLGLRTVEVRRIVGSVGRAAELGPDFLPLGHRAITQRLKRIVKAMEDGVEMPPVDLYKLKTEYYVLDGNHRVAAARLLGQLYIDAVVTEFVPVRDPDYMHVFMARQRFETATGLTGVAATEPEHYRKLLRLVQTDHKQRRARGSDRLPLKESATAWYQSVYSPQTEAIRAAKLPRAFPDRRAGDLFVYLHDYQEKHGVSFEEALEEFRRAYLKRSRRLPSLAALLHLPAAEGSRSDRPADARRVPRRRRSPARAAGEGHKPAPARGRMTEGPVPIGRRSFDLPVPGEPPAVGTDEPTAPPSSIL